MKTMIMYINDGPSSPLLEYNILHVPVVAAAPFVTTGGHRGHQQHWIV